MSVEIIDNAYHNEVITKELASGTNEHKITLNLAKSHHWYDFTLKVDGYEKFERRYAGRVETGEEGWTDPVMGRTV